MSASLKWSGLSELRESLRNMPAQLHGESRNIVEASANSAAVDIKSVYGAHRRTGNLQDGVDVDAQPSSQFGTAIMVKSKAPHAWLFDNGSQARHWASGKSTGTMWGKTPPTHAFVRTMIRHRRLMYERLKGVLERAGLRVSGDA